jgi:hypothetical protein
MIFTLIPHDHVLDIWPQVAEMLDKAARTTNGRFDKLSILDELMNNTIELWVVFDDKVPVAALTTRVSPYVEYKTLSIDWVGGSRMRDWIGDAMKTLKSYARDQGCRKLEGRGRSGWIRALKKYGWKPDYTALELELNDE